jgi:N-acetylglucosamine kinase-like BadF-type ATPase
VCGAFAGLVNHDLRGRAEDILSTLFPGAQVRAEPDYVAALYACPEGTDICVISGTGSLVCSRKDGAVVKSGGRGFILGDEGSGYQYGRDALRHFLDHPESASAQLRSAVLESFGGLAEGVVIEQLYRSGAPAAVLARLSRVLQADAKSGQDYALSSIQTHTRQLAEVVAEHAAKYQLSSRLTVGLAGGVWKSSSLVRDAFELALRERLSDRDLLVQRTTRPPLYGAVELAKELAHRN